MVNSSIPPTHPPTHQKTLENMPLVRSDTCNQGAGSISALNLASMARIREELSLAFFLPL